MASTTDRWRIVIHHLAKRFHAGSQAQRLKARRHVRYRLELQLSRRGAIDVASLFMALLSFCEISTPSLAAQGEQRRSAYFNIDRDNSITRFKRSLLVRFSVSFCM